MTVPRGASAAGLLVLCAVWMGVLCCDKSGDRRGSAPSAPGWSTYNVTNSGLADDWVLAIAVDESGAVWFGTHGGVCKFDGITWTTYDTLSSGLAANEIWATAIDRAGAKWFGTRRGVS